jgi:hypothetical protein
MSGASHNRRPMLSQVPEFIDRELAAPNQYSEHRSHITGML